jgi:hypothetical protein
MRAEPALQPPARAKPLTLVSLVGERLAARYVALRERRIAAIIAELRPGLERYLDTGYRPMVVTWSAKQREAWITASAERQAAQRIEAVTRELGDAAARELPKAVAEALARLSTMPLTPLGDGSFELRAIVGAEGAPAGAAAAP